MKKKNINKIAAISITLIIIFVISCFLKENSKVKAPLCENGYMDLSNWNFNRNGNVKINGSWEFYPNMLLSPTDFENRELPQKLYIEVPNRWISGNTKNGISDRGFGTYRALVKVDKNIYMYGLKTTNIRSSSRIFVNGREVGKNGNPAISLKEGYTSNVVPIVVFFPSEGDTLEIIIQVANLNYYNGGIIQSIYLGSEKNILNLQLKLDIFDMMEISFLILISIYYIGIYIKRREDKRFIYFSIVCLAYSYIIATGNEKIFNRLFTMLSFMLIIKIKTAFVALSIVFVSLFIQEMNRDFIPVKYMKVILVTLLINIGMILAAPFGLVALIENIVGTLNILVYIFIVTLMLRAIICKKYGFLNRRTAIFLFCGVILLTTEYITAGFYFYSLITINVVPKITLLMLIIGTSVLLFEQYSKAYSELEIMSNNLVIANKIKDEFLINTSHEFKTPLHAIINMAQAALNRKDGAITKKQEQDLTYIVSTATRLSSLVNDIIDFESLQYGKFKFTPKAFDINSIVQAVIEVLEYMRKGEEIKLINSIPSGKYYVYADDNRFKQIIINLIGNSLKYTERGYVEIKAETFDRYVYVKVKDTGIGINKNAQVELFSRNMYSGQTNFIDNASSGLGLSISKLLAVNMGGDLYLEWSESDKGSLFVVKLPSVLEAGNKEINKRDMRNKNNIITEGAYKIESSTGNINLYRDGTEKSKILIVDDEASNIKVLQEIFAGDHFEILTAYNGMRALELIKTHRDISLVLLDVMMPGMSGYEVCRKIRQEYQIFEIPIILLTVRNTPEDIAAGLDAGANDFLAKPFNIMELKARVRTLEKMKEAVKDALKMESMFLQSQIKPHFLYNALSVIMSLCNSDGERAGRLLGDLSNYLRSSFDIDPKNSFISLKKELSIAKSYIELEKARFGDRLSIEFTIDESTLDNRIPAFIIQPIVENSIRHGLMKRISGGTVKIVTEKINNYLRITIKDDGLGIPLEKLKNLLNNSYTGSIGLKNVNKRLINEYGQGLLIESTEGEGTNVVINIPVKAIN